MLAHIAESDSRGVQPVTVIIPILKTEKLNILWWTNCPSSSSDERWTMTRTQTPQMLPSVLEQKMERWIRPELFWVHEGVSNTNTNTPITCMATNRGLCVRHENAEERVMWAGCGVSRRRAWRHSRETARNTGTFPLSLALPLLLRKADRSLGLHSYSF